MRCSTNPNETSWFHSRICDNAYDLVEGLRRASDLRRTPRENPCVLICTANVFSRRVPDLGERLRFLAACLFRWWGEQAQHSRAVSFRVSCRRSPGFFRLGPVCETAGTGERGQSLEFRDHEDYLSPGGGSNGAGRKIWSVFTSKLRSRTRRSRWPLTLFPSPRKGRLFSMTAPWSPVQGYEEPAGLLPYCKDVAERRGHAEWYFQGFKERLLSLYKDLAHYLIRQDVPLVIVDEAHHWRHSHRIDCQAFRTRLAPIARRLLLLTATRSKCTGTSCLKSSPSPKRWSRPLVLSRSFA